VLLELKHGDFEKIVGIVYRLSGINLRAGKESLVKARLMKRLRALGMTDFGQYTNHLLEDRSGKELSLLIDLLTTNKTGFFRERRHFGFLRDKICPAMKNARRIRIWSAGCSSGEEPYSIMILLYEEIPQLAIRDVRMLATDISSKVIEKARTGIYDREAVRTVPPVLLQKYFNPVQLKSTVHFKVKSQIKDAVSFARMNLLDAWPMKGPFDLIVCRNVMIYFDRATQHQLVMRFALLLRTGGYLFVGHSESLSAVQHQLNYVQPAIYMK
jgi:chemotaxis protein methyltransferase CheR